MNVNVNIDRLILHGIPLTPRERRVLHGSVERELSRLLAGNADSISNISSQHVARVSTDRVRLPRENNPRQLGRQIADAVYGGIEQ